MAGRDGEKRGRKETNISRPFDFWPFWLWLLAFLALLLLAPPLSLSALTPLPIFCLAAKSRISSTKAHTLNWRNLQESDQIISVWHPAALCQLLDWYRFLFVDKIMIRIDLVRLDLIWDQLMAVVFDLSTPRREWKGKTALHRLLTSNRVDVYC